MPESFPHPTPRPRRFRPRRGAAARPCGRRALGFALLLGASLAVVGVAPGRSHGARAPTTVTPTGTPVHTSTGPSTGTPADTPTAAGAAACTPVRIGVLSHRGADITARDWEPTARWLSAALPEFCFAIVPVSFAAIDHLVREGRADFVLVNPGIYVALEVRHRISRIATMRNGAGAHARNRFGGVLFTRADRRDIRTLGDLKGRSLMAVDPTSFGGYQAAWGELLRQGIDPHRDLAALTFGGIHDAVVRAVGAGSVDVGTVRTDILERMAASGAIELADFRVLGARDDADFPLLLSTRLYPEWAFAALAHTPERLVERVAIALLQMPRDAPAARAGGYAGWTVPLDYQPVHDLLRELRQPPYDRGEPFTLAQAVARYWPWLLVALAVLVLLAALAWRVAQLNRRLHRAKAALEQRQALILDSVAEGIYGVDQTGRTTFVNRAMERMTGWTAAELIGSDQHNLIHHSREDGEAHAREQCPVYATLADGEPRLIDDDLFWRSDGERFPVEYSVTPIRDAAGAVLGSVVVCRDITERRRTDARMRRLELQQAHVARLSTLGEMASGIAHELNQPLTAISTNARACLRMAESVGASADTCTAVLETIAEQAERAGEVIRHVRRFVRKEQPQTHPIAVAELFDTVLVLLREDARLHGVRMTCCIGYGVGNVGAQRTQIEQVLLNLAYNAIEAMDATRRQRRRLHLSARAHHDRVLIAVSDTGPGIAAEVRERLFEPFVTNKPEGLGLGLSISAGICEAHGGRLSATDDLGGGTRFAFSLPAAPDPAPA